MHECHLLISHPIPRVTIYNPIVTSVTFSRVSEQANLWYQNKVRTWKFRSPVYVCFRTSWDFGSILPINMDRTLCECKFWLEFICVSRITSPHLIGAAAEHTPELFPSLTWKRESEWALSGVRVTVLWPLPPLNRASELWRKYPVGTWVILIALPQVTGPSARQRHD